MVRDLLIALRYSYVYFRNNQIYKRSESEKRNGRKIETKKRKEKDK